VENLKREVQQLSREVELGKREEIDQRRRNKSQDKRAMPDIDEGSEEKELRCWAVDGHKSTKKA